MAETDKNTRILELHTMLTRGECLRKKDLAQRFGVTEKSIQRDIEDLRDFFTRSGEPRVLAYDAKERAYVLRADKACTIFVSRMGIPIRDKRMDQKRVPIDLLFCIGTSQCRSGGLLALLQ